MTPKTTTNKVLILTFISLVGVVGYLVKKAEFLGRVCGVEIVRLRGGRHTRTRSMGTRLNTPVTVLVEKIRTQPIML